MDRNDFIQSSATIRVLEKKLLDRASLERLIEADGLEEALRYLNDSIYQGPVAKLEKPEDYEEVLKAEQLRFFEELYSISPSKIPVDLVTCKYMYHNLKVLLKEAIQEEDYRNLYVHLGDIDLKKLRDEFEGEGKKSYSDHYLDIVEEARRKYEETKDPQSMEIYIDKAYFEEMLTMAEKSGIDLFKTYVKDLIDFTNIRTILRAKRQNKDLEFLKEVIIDKGFIPKERYYDFLNVTIDPDSALFKSSNIYKFVRRGISEYENTGSLILFEREMDNYLISLAKEAKKVTYGPEVIFGYGLAKETEIKNLRIIFVSKLNKLDNDFIRERLRDSYV